MADEHIDRAVQSVLATSKLKLSHPGNGKISQLYPTPSDVTSILAQAVSYRGQLRVSPNNKQFGNRSDFILNASTIVSDLAINGVFTMNNSGPPFDKRAKINAIGFGFDLIESIEISFTNSLMENLFIKGETLKDYSLLCCPSDKERQDMLKAAGQMINGHNNFMVSQTYNFTVPLSFLNFTTGSLRNSWPIDASVIAGPINIAIIWRTAAYALTAVGATPYPIPSDLPQFFDKLQMVGKMNQLQDASFTVKKAMMLSPSLVYSLPARYITSVDYSQAGVPGTPIAVNIDAVPTGMLEGIIVSIRPVGGVSNETWGPPLVDGMRQYRGGSCTLDAIRLEFGGQKMYNSESYEEHLHYMRNTFGDNMEWPGTYYTSDLSYTEPDANAGCNLEMYVHPIYFIPLINDGCSVFRHHTNENVPSYGGTQLNLFLTPSSHQRVKPSVSPGIAVPTATCAPSWQMNDTSVNQDTMTFYSIQIGFVISALLEVSEGTVDLQL